MIKEKNYEYFIWNNISMKLRENKKITRKIIIRIINYELTIDFGHWLNFKKIKKIIKNNSILQRKIIKTSKINPVLISKMIIFIKGKLYKIKFINSNNFYFKIENKLLIYGNLKKYNYYELISLWVKKYSKLLFKIYIDEIIKTKFPKLALKLINIKIFEAKTIWGSCLINKKNKITISLNTKLLHFPSPYLEYVIIHEISHIKYLNHSKSFWNLVHNNMKNYLLYKKTINNYEFI